VLCFQPRAEDSQLRVDVVVLPASCCYASLVLNISSLVLKISSFVLMFLCFQPRDVMPS
jgi:hypothetical protein